MADSLNERQRPHAPWLIQSNKETAGYTRELDNFRERLAADFHDETGNLLLTIIHQASLLKMCADKGALPMIENILSSGNQLYAISKHLLWNLSHDDDDPYGVFEYIAAFGQSFYNQFDICFSVKKAPGCPYHAGKLAPLAALNLVFIFKEAMNNVIKHAGAREVVLKMSVASHRFIFELADDGIWKEPDSHQIHYGLESIERRCSRNNFTCQIRHDNGKGTQMEISVPVISTGLTIQHA